MLSVSPPKKLCLCEKTVDVKAADNTREMERQLTAITDPVQRESGRCINSHCAGIIKKSLTFRRVHCCTAWWNKKHCFAYLKSNMSFSGSMEAGGGGYDNFMPNDIIGCHFKVKNPFIFCHAKVQLENTAFQEMCWVRG